MHRPHKFDPPWIDFFTRPCPWFAKQLASFPQFPRLPPELQLRIWERAIPCRQIVSLSYPAAVSDNDMQSDSKPTFGFNLQYRRPGMPQACYDARVADLTHFAPTFESYLPSPIRFSFNRDYLELDIEMVLWIAYMHGVKGVALVEPPMVNNLAISLPRQLTADTLVMICRHFSNLKVLLINEPEFDDSRPTSGFPHSFPPADANFSSRHRWRELRNPIMRPIRGVRPKLDKWDPPLLIVGTDTQWARHALIPTRGVFRDDIVSDSDSMDWQPTISVPSLEYVPRLETVSGPTSALTIEVQTAINDEAEEDFQEHFKIRSWVFEDASLRFRELDSNSCEDYENWVWPGR